VPPAAQMNCPICDDELYGIKHKCAKCLREFHAHCANAGSSRNVRWACPDCEKSKGTTSSSHEPTATANNKRPRAHGRRNH
jgi:hypothetical protein